MVKHYCKVCGSSDTVYVTQHDGPPATIAVRCVLDGLSHVIATT